MVDLSPESLLSEENKIRFINNAKKLGPGPDIDDDTPKLRASVLILMCVVDNEVCVIFTLRSSKLRRNAGQISFPGGKMDAGETSTLTALRETNEELGIPSSDIVIWTELPKIIGLDNELSVIPVVGFLPNFDLVKLNPNIDEVEEVYTVPIKSLVNKNNQGYVLFRNTFRSSVFNCAETENNPIWGITGLMLAFFLTCLVPDNVYDGDITGTVEYKYDQLSKKSKL